MFRRYGAAIVVVVATAATALAVWVASNAQRSASDNAFAEVSAAQGILTGMLDQETGARGFFLTGREDVLEPYRRGQRELAAVLARARRDSTESDEVALLKHQEAAIRSWHAAIGRQIARVRRRGPEIEPPAHFLSRKRLFDRFRRVNASFRAELSDEREHHLRRAASVSAAVIGLLAAVFVAVGTLLMRRQRRHEYARLRREREYRESQAEFGETMQLMRDEAEAHDLVRRHLSRSIPDAEVLVLNRNNSDDRLEAASSDDAASMEERLEDATPESCLAVRLGREHRDGPGCDPLLACEVCGGRDRNSLCVPSLVGGEVIGAVLVSRADELQTAEVERVEQSVAQAAPVLANLRNLAIAETRAATDSLTGLPNNRSAVDTLKRMAAHAGRSASSLAAILLDLDHFKQINDRFGHGAGDNVLAAVGDVLLHGLRASDFASRYGGEEFLALLPDTDLAAAAQVAENLRVRIERVRVPEVERAITASMGVAVLPDHAADAESLLRMADRALYAAKGAGRNQVKLAETRPARAPEPARV